jgi:hypothetical protein
VLAASLKKTRLIGPLFLPSWVGIGRGHGEASSACLIGGTFDGNAVSEF